MLELTISDGETEVSIMKRQATLMQRIANKRAFLCWRLDEEMFRYSADPKNARRAQVHLLNRALGKLGAKVEDIGRGHALKLVNPVTIKGEE